MEIVFDFDGTIADTFDQVVMILNRLSEEYGYEPVGEKEITRFKEIGTKKALKSFGISWLQFIRVGRRVQRELNQEIPTVEIFEGIGGVLGQLKADGHTLGILSSDIKSNIVKFLDKYQLDMFDYVESCGLIWGKKRHLKRIMRRRGIEANNLIYIGDETKDIIAAHKAGVRIISVNWGYNSKVALSKYNPDYMVDDSAELLEVIRKLS